MIIYTGKVWTQFFPLYFASFPVFLRVTSLKLLPMEKVTWFGTFQHTITKPKEGDGVSERI